MGNGNAIRRVIAVFSCSVLAACGAGLVADAIANRGGGGESRPPELSVSSVFPLVPAEGAARTVVVTNTQIAAGAPVRVEIEAAGVTVSQPAPRVTGQGNSSSVVFTLDTAAIAAAVGDPTAADVAGTLRVLVAGRPAAPALPITLVRQPAAVLALEGGGTELLVAPSGEVVRLRVTGLRSTNPADVQMLVTVRDPTQPVTAAGAAMVTRQCTGLRLEAAPEPGVTMVSALLPGIAFPEQARLFVRDAVAGQSTVVTNAYYRPAILQALPRQGPTTGGDLVTLIGQALVPYDFAVAEGALPQLAFDDVELEFRKAETGARRVPPLPRVTPLPREDFRPRDSDRDRLVFVMPSSPDGRPGLVEVVLRVRLDGQPVEVAADDVFLFANANPFFGPRGALLDAPPVAVAPIHLDLAPRTDGAPDFVVLTEEGGVGYVQLLLAQQNGMFQRFGERRRLGDPAIPAERRPRDLCSGDFDGDGVPDLFVANAGETTASMAVHHVLLGQARPSAPLGTVHRVVGQPGTWRVRAARLDGDALPDLLLVPGIDAPPGLQPQVRLARPAGPGAPAFAPDQPVLLPLRYEAVEVADLDGDGDLDIAGVVGSTLHLDVALGRGDGSFAPAVSLDFTVPGYTATPFSTAVGLHACGDAPLQSLALVLSGSDEPTALREPQIRVLRQVGAGIYTAPTAGNVPSLGLFPPLGRSLAADLDPAMPGAEIAVSVRGELALFNTVLALLRWTGAGYELIQNSLEEFSQRPRQVTALLFDRAYPGTAQSGEAMAVFVVHESLVDGVRERWLSTRLVSGANADLRLLPPDAGETLTDPIEGIVSGHFHLTRIAGARDVALARSNSVTLGENDGFGGRMLLSTQMSHADLLPGTLQRLPATAPTVDGLVFVDRSSRVGFWRHDAGLGEMQPPTALSGELRLASASAVLRTATLSDATRVRIADVDGDDNADLVVLLSFELPAQAEGTAAIALLRGRLNPAPGEFPFFEPTVLTPVHGNASSLALGDFVAATEGARVQLELAVAVPQGTQPAASDGDHVRFFRYAPGANPAADRFAASALAGGPQVLLAGSRPTELAAADLDDDTLVDLVVAAAGDRTLRVFRNLAPRTTAPGEVAVGAFQESLASPRPLAAGMPRRLRLDDVNGDGALDAVAMVQSVAGNARSTAVAFYLQAGTGGGVLGDPVFVSPLRLGNRDAAMALDLGDCNGDGALDLMLGWSNPGDRNLRWLFGGSR